MNKDTLNIKYITRSPWHIQLFAIVLVIGSIALFATNFVMAVILLFVGMLILSSYSGVQINRMKKTYRAYNSFLFIKMGGLNNYEVVEKIYINQNQVSQKIYTAHTTSSQIFNNIKYDGYVKFDDGTKVHLMSKKDKSVLMNRLKEYADFLEVELQDNTLDN